MNFTKQPQSHPSKYVAYVALGNFLENYDFALYVHFASILSFLFFPAYFNPDDSIVLSFTISCMISLVATKFWGYISDIKGRKVPLVWSCWIAGIAMFLIPLQATIFEKGLLSAFLFCVLRGCVDFALTGEYLNTNLYITESYPQKQASFFSALVDFVCNMGVATGLLSAVWCMANLGEHGWKVPFVIGGCVALGGWWTRRKIKDSLDFLRIPISPLDLSREQYEKARKELKPLWRKVVGIEMLFGFGFFFVYLYCPKFLLAAGYTVGDVLWNNLYVGLVQGLASLLYGVMALVIPALTITKVRGLILFGWSVFLIFVFSTWVKDPNMVFLIQAVTVFLALDHIPAIPVFLKKFPVIIRARSFNDAFFYGKNCMYLLTAFFIYSIEALIGSVGVIFIWCSIIAIFCYAIWTFETTFSEDQWANISLNFSC